MLAGRSHARHSAAVGRRPRPLMRGRPAGAIGRAAVPSPGAVCPLRPAPPRDYSVFCTSDGHQRDLLHARGAREERMTNLVWALRGAAAGAMMVAALAPLALAQAPAPAQQGPWLTLTPFPVPSEELLGAVAGGKFYAFAGLAPGWKP